MKRVVLSSSCTQDARAGGNGVYLICVFVGFMLVWCIVCLFVCLWGCLLVCVCLVVRMLFGCGFVGLVGCSHVRLFVCVLLLFVCVEFDMCMSYCIVCTYPAWFIVWFVSLLLSFVSVYEFSSCTSEPMYGLHHLVCSYYGVCVTLAMLHLWYVHIVCFAACDI
jgi:hypothetical protein